MENLEDRGRSAARLEQAGDNACAGLDPEERQALREAAQILVADRGLVVRITEFLANATSGLGGRVGQFGERVFGPDFRDRVTGLAEAALQKSFGLATAGVAGTARRPPSARAHRALGAASGVVTGFIGLPAAPVDIAVTTGLIFRSIAQIAQSFGEDIAQHETRRACLEVFALGGPAPGDEGLETGYWTARIALNHTVIAELLRLAAARFGIVLSQKLVADATPVLGGIAGAGLNYVFIEYYQQMARVHFTLRQLERRHDRESVRACFDRMLEEARGPAPE